MEPLPGDVQMQMQKMQETVGGLKAALQLFLGKSSKELDSEMDPLQRAQVHLALAQAAASLFQLFLKSKGVDPEEHSFKMELKRIAQYDKKVRKAVATQELKNSKPTLQVDVAAMNRFIAAAVPESREALKRVGEAAAAARKRAVEDVQSGPSSGGKTKKKKESHKDAALTFLQETLAEANQPAPGGGN